MIPKIIHQIWIQGEEHIPENLLQNKFKNKNLHRHWKYIVWDEINIIELLQKTNKKWLKKYQTFTYLHQKVDYAKLIILYTHGGVCIDMDAYAIKRLDDLVSRFSNYDFIVSKLRDFSIVGNYFICRHTNQCLNNGNYLGKPNTDILRYMIENISTDCSFVPFKEYCIGITTGPLYFNQVIRKYMNEKRPSKILILDNEYLEPCVHTECVVTDNTYIKHEHANTWISDFAKVIMDLYIHYTLLCNILLFSLIGILLYAIIFYALPLLAMVAKKRKTT